MQIPPPESPIPESPPPQRLAAQLGDALLDALAVLAPTDCAGCGAPDRRLCPRCATAVSPAGPIFSPGRTLVGGLPVWSVFEYAGVVRNVLVEFKDGGRTSLARALAPALREGIMAAMAAALAATRTEIPVRLATIPSSRAGWRRRGYAPVDLLVKRAGLHHTPVLTHARQPRDQAGLGRQQRQENRSGSLRTKAGCGQGNYLLIDDIVTTGATLIEAARAVSEAGGIILGAVTVAHTPLRFPGSSQVPPGVAGKG